MTALLLSDALHKVIPNYDSSAPDVQRDEIQHLLVNTTATITVLVGLLQVFTVS